MNQKIKFAMNWYIAKLVFNITSGDGKHTPQFDEQLRMVMAQNKMQAFEKARTLGETEEDAFFNDSQQPVKWQFVDVAELLEIKELTDGMEIFSRIEEASDAHVYKNMIHHKAMILKTELQPFF